MLSVVANDPQGQPIGLTIKETQATVDFRLFGDVEKDGVLTVADAIKVLRSIVGMIELSPAEAFYADVHVISSDGKPYSGRYTGNDSVDVADAIRILKVITGQWALWWPDTKP